MSMQKSQVVNPLIALVTGASRGIGRAIAFRLAAEGFHVIINYRKSEDDAKSLCKWIESKGYPEAWPIQADVSNLEEVKRLFFEIKMRFGSLTVLVNNAGMTSDNLFLLTKDENWWSVLESNLKPVINCCRMALPFMISQNSGQIINITSISGLHGSPGQTAYSASKAAIAGFSRSLAREVSRYGICINCVAPGLFDTDMVKSHGEQVIQRHITRSQIKRLGKPEEVAELVTMLASGKVGFLFGQEIIIDGGLSM